MTSSPRYITSLVMTAVYLLVVFAPLAPVALHSNFVLHAVTGECSGDCRICGCSAERSAAHSCCCALKKMADDKRLKVGAGDCCKSKGKIKQHTSSCSSRPAEGEHDEHGDNCQTGGNKSGETTIAAAPCSSGKFAALAETEQIQHMPFKYASNAPQQMATSYRTPFMKRLINHPGEPPDPPPKISVLS